MYFTVFYNFLNIFFNNFEIVKNVLTIFLTIILKKGYPDWDPPARVRAFYPQNWPESGQFCGSRIALVNRKSVTKLPPRTQQPHKMTYDAKKSLTQKPSKTSEFLEKYSARGQRLSICSPPGYPSLLLTLPQPKSFTGAHAFKTDLENKKGLWTFSGFISGPVFFYIQL